MRKRIRREARGVDREALEALALLEPKKGLVIKPLFRPEKVSLEGAHPSARSPARASSPALAPPDRFRGTPKRRRCRRRRPSSPAPIAAGGQSTAARSASEFWGCRAEK